VADTKTPKTARIDATHMGPASLRDGKTQSEKDEDWGVDNTVVVTDDDLNDAEEREIETNSPRGGEDSNTQTRSQTVTTATATATPEVPETTSVAMSADDFFAMQARMDQFKAGAITDLQDRQKALDNGKTAFLADYDQKSQEINEKLQRLGVQVNTPVEDEPAVKTRRGRRRRVPAEGATAPAAATSGEATSGRRTRPKNDMTLKEAIVEVLTKKGRADLKTIAQEIVASGFKTNSKKFGNTVRVQLYRLDDDQQVVQYDDNTFGLKKPK
jgi:hypothetical protein